MHGWNHWGCAWQRQAVENTAGIEGGTAHSQCHSMLPRTRPRIRATSRSIQGVKRRTRRSRSSSDRGPSSDSAQPESSPCNKQTVSRCYAASAGSPALHTVDEPLLPQLASAQRPSQRPSQRPAPQPAPQPAPGPSSSSHPTHITRRQRSQPGASHNHPAPPRTTHPGARGAGRW